MKSNAYNGNRFAIVPDVEVPRSKFDSSFGVKTSFDADYLIPIFSDEVLPGDTLQLSVSHLVRMATPIYPIMDNLHLDMFFFFVPNRILWENWERMNGAQDNPGDTTDYLTPILNVDEPLESMSIHDYFGLPIDVEGIEPISLYHRAYNLIYNEWFRDQNLIDSVPVPKGDGPDNLNNYKLLKRAKFHDYFTSALPWPQKGPGVELPLVGNATIKVDPSKINLSGINNGIKFSSLDGTSTYGLGNNNFVYWQSPGNANNKSIDALTADMTSVASATINDIRQAFALQRLYERDARGGTRYVEILKSHFGVTSPDFRLQRPEFLGSLSHRINVTPVVNQTGTSDRPQGGLAGFGVSTNTGHGFNASFTEHGVVIGLMSIRSDLTYSQGLERRFSRRSRFDYYYPSLAHLGEQEIYNKEIYCKGDENDTKIFGYQERYADYRYKNSQLTGLMRPTVPQSLSAWHLSQKFDNLPTLSKDFIECNTPISRVVAVPSESHFYGDFYFDYKRTRPMPLYGTPGMIDYF